MRAGREYVRASGQTLRRGEHVQPFGDGWLISSKNGFEPCPWSFQLAQFCHVCSGDRVLDLGCGAGPLLVALAEVHPQIGMRVGLELVARHADQALRNLRVQNHGRYGVIKGDVRQLPLPGGFNLVVVNPPFYPPGWGRVSGDPVVAQATHALNGDVSDFARAAAGALAADGSAVFVFDAHRLTDLLLAISCAGLVTRRLRFLDDDRGKPARVLAHATIGGTGVVVEREAFAKGE